MSLFLLVVKKNLKSKQKKTHTQFFFLGDLVRKEIKEETSLGKKMKEALKGNLLPDDMICSLAMKHLGKHTHYILGIFFCCFFCFHFIVQVCIFYFF